jgi:hypothetical protein
MRKNCPMTPDESDWDEEWHADWQEMTDEQRAQHIADVLASVRVRDPKGAETLGKLIRLLQRLN